MIAPAPARVLVVDDHPLFRAGVVHLIREDPRLRVVAESGSADDGLATALRERPDLVLVDLRMPGAGGIDLARRLLAELPDTRVVIVTGQDSEESIRQSLEAGVHGYVIKTANAESLVAALLTVLAGGQVVPRRPRSSSGPPLTLRELEVLKLLAHGSANKEIARRLGISERTARNHVTHIYEKLGVGHRTEAVRYAIRQGLVEP